MTILSSKYDYFHLREYAALSNVPIIYCLSYEKDTHRIARVWAYQWLIDFVNTSDPVVFHPEALRLVKENLPNWVNPFTQKNDYRLFLEGVFKDDLLEAEQMIIEAIKQNRLLYKDRTTDKWTLR